jgi:hypothetical protein
MYRYSFRLIQVIDFECFKYNKKSISLAGGVCVVFPYRVTITSKVRAAVQRTGQWLYHHRQSRLWTFDLSSGWGIFLRTVGETIHICARLFFSLGPLGVVI